jgi:hypothetical protein
VLGCQSGTWTLGPFHALAFCVYSLFNQLRNTDTDPYGDLGLGKGEQQLQTGCAQMGKKKKEQKMKHVWFFS